MKIEIPEFEVFPDSNISGRFIINNFWLEHLLNLFYQGYPGKVWEELMDTKINHYDLIEKTAYSIIAENFDKEHIDMEKIKC
jgi:hypothetical protein